MRNLHKSTQLETEKCRDPDQGDLSAEPTYFLLVLTYFYTGRIFFRARSSLGITSLKIFHFRGKEIEVQRTAFSKVTWGLMVEPGLQFSHLVPMR